MSCIFDRQRNQGRGVRLLTWASLVVAWCVTTQMPLRAQTPALQPIFWQQPVLFIPYQVNKQVPGAEKIAQVQLLMSRTGAHDWQTLQSAQANVLGFSYHAPQDGTYWFSLRHLDAQGRTLDEQATVAQLQIVIDSQRPQLTLAAMRGARDEVIVRYEAADPHLLPGTLMIEARTADGLWTNLPLTTPDVAQPDRLVGRVSWSPPTATMLKSAGRSPIAPV